MTDESEPSRPDPINDLISLAAVPIASVMRSFDQLRRGTDELVRGLENFNTTMESVNETAQRVNRLLDDLEEPVRAAVPRLARTLKTADDIAGRLTEPMDRVIPGLSKLGDTLNSPVITALPTDLGSFMDTMNDLARRLGPLGQLAESAGGMFGLRLPGFGGSRSPTAPTTAAGTASAEPAATVATTPTTAASPSATKAAKKVAAKKRAPKKAATKRSNLR